MSGWKVEGDELHVVVRVPANARATVRLPGATLARVTERGRPLASAAAITGATQDGDAVVLEIGSGDYAFAYAAPALITRLRQ